VLLECEGVSFDARSGRYAGSSPERPSAPVCLKADVAWRTRPYARHMSSGAIAGAPAVPRRAVQRSWVRGALPLLALALFAWSVATVWTSDSDVAGGPAVGTLIAALVTLPLAGARRWPLPTALLVCTGAGLDYWLGGGLGQAWFAVLVAAYVLGERAGVAARTVGMVAVAALTLAVDVPRLRDAAPLDEVLPGWFVLGAVYGLGRWVATRRVEQARLRERALAAEADREEATRVAVAHERALIARELHDLVAHSLSVVVLQAQGGQRVVESDPAAARAALGTIEGLGREGMSELRRLLGIMGSDPDPAAAGNAGTDADPAAADAPGSRGAGWNEATAPVPSLAGLPTLVERVGAAGLPVELSVEGLASGRPLPAGLELTAYRIVQEALTNALRHAGPATAHARVVRGAGSLEVSVVDTGRGSGAASGERGGAGRGLIGMRERAALFGGTLTAGPRAGGGFEVVARFPLEDR